MRSFTIILPDEAAAKLAQLARRDLRAPRHEGAALLIEAIERAARPRRRLADRGRPARGSSDG